MSEVSGIPLTEFGDPVRVALTEYAERMDGRYYFDLDNAPRLDFVPGKLTARSQTEVKQGDEKIADLFVVAFAPNDGTGDEQTYAMDQVRFGQFPKDPRYIPRSKVAAHSEVHMALAAKDIDDTSADPTLFAGHLRLLGLRGNRITDIGYVGQGPDAFSRHVGPEPYRWLVPTATLTTGYRQGADVVADSGERFGDPHAVINQAHRIVQVAGFVALSPEVASRHFQLVRLLGAGPLKPAPKL